MPYRSNNFMSIWWFFSFFTFTDSVVMMPAHTHSLSFLFFLLKTQTFSRLYVVAPSLIFRKVSIHSRFVFGWPFVKVR
jgi:hypothetical protein